jgi:hypothetical protein
MEGLLGVQLCLLAAREEARDGAKMTAVWPKADNQAGRGANAPRHPLDLARVRAVVGRLQAPCSL